jgi:pimeloyl-ACP methyl ester carboxylesterase
MPSSWPLMMTGVPSGSAQVFRAYTPEQRAHGRTPDVDGPPVSYELMAQDTIMFIEGVIGQPVYLLGVSDGGLPAVNVCTRLVLKRS